MVAILKRMRKLKTLLNIRLGPGAALINPEVQRIHMDFAKRMNDGHMGPRKFWHTYLPRLKYHNPAIPMTVNRTDDQSGSATLTVFFTPAGARVTPAHPAAGTSSTSNETTPSEYTGFERTETIDMKHKHESEILAQLLALVNGKQVQATAAETAELAVLEEQRQRGEKDAQIMKGVLAAKRRQAEILEQARKSVEAASS